MKYVITNRSYFQENQKKFVKNFIEIINNVMKIKEILQKQQVCNNSMKIQEILQANRSGKVLKKFEKPYPVFGGILEKYV